MADGVHVPTKAGSTLPSAGQGTRDSMWLPCWSVTAPARQYSNHFGPETAGARQSNAKKSLGAGPTRLRRPVTLEFSYLTA